MTKSNIFDRFLEELEDEEEFEFYSEASIRWFTRNVSSMARVNRKDIERNNPVQHNVLGNFFHFYYMPKGKQELPYYDRFPLVLCIETYKNGFLGLNLHYLDYRTRAYFFGALYEVYHMPRGSREFVLRWKDIKINAYKLRAAYPCLKRYLLSHMQSKAILIKPEHWKIALFLPTEYFMKENKRKVWKDSKQMMLLRATK